MTWNKGTWLRGIALGFLGVPLLTILLAQSAGTGGLTGTVTDSSGAVVPNATVTVTNQDTSQERTANTGGDGVYRLALLPPGTYKVKIVANGFKPVEISGITVSVTETPVLDRKLELGAQVEQVTVAENAETIQTATSTLGTVVGANTATSLPLNTRNYTNLLGLSAGANASVNNATGLGKGAMEIATNGSSVNQNNFQMDGAPITSFASNGNIGQGNYPTFGIPNPDTIAEFKIQTSLYDAGYGRNPGANVNVITKSGTNSFHGTAFEFFRNTDLNANDFFRNRSGGGKLVLNQNQFGGTLGGPIKKDKLFFFASMQESRQRNGAASQGFSSGITLFPIPQGDRSNTAAFQAALGAAFCHAPTNPGGAGAGQGMQVACDGSNINPVAIKLLQAKNPDGTYFIPSSALPGQNQTGVTYSDPAHDTEHQGMINLDYLLSPKHTLASRYFIADEPQAIPFACANCLPGTFSTNEYGYQDGVLKLTSVLTSNIVNEARASVQRSVIVGNKIPPVTNQQGGITPLGPTLTAAPLINISGAFQAGGSFGNFSQLESTQFQYADQLSWTHGKHTIRAGGEFEKVDWNWTLQGLSQGIMAFQTFSDFLIGLPGACGPQVVGICNGSNYSNILNTQSFSVRSSPSGIVHAYRVPDGNLFVQDDIKFNQRLTVNLGLRWEFDGLPSDKYGNATTLWRSAILAVPVPGSSPATGSYAGWVIPSNYQSNIWGTPPSGVSNSGSNIPTKVGTSLKNFAPRAGFAWQPFGSNKFVMRGGAGFFYDRVGGGNFLNAIQQSPPYALTLDQGPSTNQFASLANPFQSTPLGTFPVRWVNFANGTGSNISQPLIQESYVTPLVYSYNFNFQYEFLPHWVLEAGYVGSHGIHQAQSRQEINEALLATAGSPVNGVTTNTVGNALLRAPYLGFSPGGLQLAATNGDFKFNSLQATVRRQFSQGLTLQAAYTFSRAFSDLTGPNTGSNSGDPLNLSQQYGLNPNYRPQRLVIIYGWNIPHGHLKGVAEKFLGGWNLSGVTTIQGGQPMSIYDSRGGAIYGMSGSPGNILSRGQMASGQTYANVATPGGLEARLGGASGGCGYFVAIAPPAGCTIASAFTNIPVVGQVGGVGGGMGWGNSGVGIILGPGQFNFDTTIAKTTRVGGIHEDAALQFRAEFFNLFNHPQFSNPANNLAVPNFGQITSTSVNPRLIQLALKYIF